MNVLNGKVSYHMTSKQSRKDRLNSDMDKGFKQGAGVRIESRVSNEQSMSAQKERSGFNPPVLSNHDVSESEVYFPSIKEGSKKQF